jgi:NTP pyrophosphatase (non-canonical NTP hydrolase)
MSKSPKFEIGQKVCIREIKDVFDVIGISARYVLYDPGGPYFVYDIRNSNRKLTVYEDELRRCPAINEHQEDRAIDDDMQCKMLNKFGIDHQSIIAMEELSELQKAISKASRYIKNTKFDSSNNRYIRNMAEEIADVMICIRQMKLYYAISEDMIINFIKEKQARDKKRYFSER